MCLVCLLAVPVPFFSGGKKGRYSKTKVHLVHVPQIYFACNFSITRWWSCRWSRKTENLSRLHRSTLCAKRKLAPVTSSLLFYKHLFSFFFFLSWCLVLVKTNVQNNHHGCTDAENDSWCLFLFDWWGFDSFTYSSTEVEILILGSDYTNEHDSVYKFPSVGPYVYVKNDRWSTVMYRLGCRTTI